MNEIVQVNALELHTANIKEDHKNLPLEGVNTRRVILANGLAFLAASGTHYATRHRKAKNNDQRNRHNHQLLSVKLVIMLTTAETIRTSSSNSHKSQKDKKKEKYRLKQKLKKQNNASHHSPASPASPKSSFVESSLCTVLVDSDPFGDLEFTLSTGITVSSRSLVGVMSSLSSS